ELREKAAGSRYAILAENSDKDLPNRLGRIAALASDGPAALPELLKALDDSDAAVRYWAATGLGNIGEEAKTEGLAPAGEALKDKSAVVRVAAARALIRMGEAEEALPVLEKELAGPEQWTRLHAAIVLDEAGDVARPALPNLKQALKDQPNKYIVRVANKAVNDLEGTENAVP
ncbi:MAG: HEAT repeat domain-containing protein, partial [Verrucomicrobiae bacterium]|nr:HEAT repeat domain-containing protein [Verrucomicrobiae bacterium]